MYSFQLAEEVQVSLLLYELQDNFARSKSRFIKFLLPILVVGISFVATIRRKALLVKSVCGSMALISAYALSMVLILGTFVEVVVILSILIICIIFVIRIIFFLPKILILIIRFENPKIRGFSKLLVLVLRYFRYVKKSSCKP